MPQVFYWIQLGTVGGKLDERNVLGNSQRLAAVEASSIPDHHRMFVCGDRFGEHLNKGIHHRRIQTGAEQPLDVAALRTNGLQHPQVFVFGLPHGGRREPVGAQTSSLFPAVQSGLHPESRVAAVDLDETPGPPAVAEGDHPECSIRPPDRLCGAVVAAAGRSIPADAAASRCCITSGSLQILEREWFGNRDREASRRRRQIAGWLRRVGETFVAHLR